MKSTYLNDSIEDSYTLFSRIKSGIRKAGLVALSGTLIGVGVYGCKKEEPDVWEKELYEQTKIAFTSDRDGNDEIYVMNADGSEQKNLTNNRALDCSPSWSPTGKKIAFCSKRNGNAEIYVMNADGSEQKNLTNNLSDDEFPSWSPDGKKIAFAKKGFLRKNPEIYVMNADGSEQKRLTNNPGFDGHPSWSPFLPLENKTNDKKLKLAVPFATLIMPCLPVDPKAIMLHYLP